ncbi:TPA: hypothetical protein DEW47_03195 [Patescibacteria group bacterium]|nr:MAG: Cell division protein FtsK/SpoIIIE [Parcubacteria group bacterium GW2011_GWF2_40_10]KKR48032.1 MAG: Cell division protein FtsK/SpoIIIE [Parcubacteria group bacterium GW2011_GWA2_40_143]KKR60512.1 MAG: Cell division protein FtsK/SpoIIIE [Parcubacteria group bacterium GW2011_GWC2_40_31]KKR75639.1 MAG: Cell division protein FtsK/SpoIIIE [Parcubacteria group bacterium GW2011_GWB2_40_8]KKR76852.1 MAG: Cell division protein FtsK/SpoIIIE [Parcubacteria group bacterium GW2011_GWE2_40_8]HBB5677
MSSKSKAKKQKIKHKKEEEKEEDEPKESFLNALEDRTKNFIISIVLFSFGTVFTLSYFNKAGPAGKYINNIFDSLFGNGSILLPLALFASAGILALSIKPSFLKRTLIGIAVFLIGNLGIMATIWGKDAGGYIGYLTSLPLMKLFDFWASIIILSAILVVSATLIINKPIFAFIPFKLKRREADDDIIQANHFNENGGAVEEKENAKESAHVPAESGAGKAMEIKKDKKRKEGTGKDKEEEYEEGSISYPKQNKVAFIPPPLELLEGDRGKPSSGDIKANANIIKRTLQNFGIDVEMGEINIGPSVTQYTLKPAEGVKLARIVALQNDLALSLAAHPIRIEAPIPSRSLVGIEIPNSTKTIIGLATLFKESDYQNGTHPLLVTFGRSVGGQAAFYNLAKMPHLLVAGATGSGKSIYIHSLIMSLLYRNSPEDLRFIMIDPKRVELTVYNKIPHMLTPVITETKKAILILKWLTKEMERRYDTLLSAGVRNIESYRKEEASDKKPMPYLVVVIDELADLMSTYPREMEASIVRLAQMSRAVGIHLVLSTQRPSVEVITGLIKANVPSRVALQVASQIDSRTILDMSGAEKLLGNGDMLYLVGDSAKPRRVQGPYVTDKEIKNVVDFLADTYKDFDLEDIDTSAENGGSPSKARGAISIDLDQVGMDEDADDEMYEEARATVIEFGKASTSFLQRKLKVGYARAARLMDMLEERGIISQGDGAKPRQVLVESRDAFADAVDDYKDENGSKTDGSEQINQQESVSTFPTSPSEAGLADKDADQNIEKNGNQN